MGKWAQGSWQSVSSAATLKPANTNPVGFRRLTQWGTNGHNGVSMVPGSVRRPGDEVPLLQQMAAAAQLPHPVVRQADITSA